MSAGSIRITATSTNGTVPRTQTSSGSIIDQCSEPGAPKYVPPPSCYTNGARNVGLAGAPGYILGPMPFGDENAAVWDRSSLVNIHIGIPHKHDALRDDIQILHDNDTITSPLYVSAQDEGLQNLQGSYYPAGTKPFYWDWYQYTGQPGTFLPDDPAAAKKNVIPYFFPSSNPDRAFHAPIGLDVRDVQYNQQAVAKLQYQKNFSSDAYLRIYGYTYFATYTGAGAVSSWQPYTGYDSGDYELNAHTRGLSATFSKQFGSQHLVSLQGSYTTATSMDYNNSEMFGSADNFAVLVNPKNLNSGICYALPADPSRAATPITSCNLVERSTYSTRRRRDVGDAGPAQYGTNRLEESAVRRPRKLYVRRRNVRVLRCGELTVAGQVERVTPTFNGLSLTDEYRPSDKMVFNLGIRLDQYNFKGEDTTGGPARAFWFAAFNHDSCYDTNNLTLYDKTALPGVAPIHIGQPCSAAGPQFQNVNMQNTQTNFTYNIWQPRLGATYTVNADTVLRASWGKYNEQPSSSYEQYNALQQNLPTELIPYYSQGFNSAGHAVRPAVSFNSDFSLEHHFKGTDLSFKVTPFLRQTHDEIENFYISLKQGIIAGLNAGNETSNGFEFELNKGDFDKNGFAGQLSFAYTNVYVKYSSLPNGTTVLTPINADIANYNAYTKVRARRAAAPTASGSSARRCAVRRPAARRRRHATLRCTTTKVTSSTARRLRVRPAPRTRTPTGTQRRKACWTRTASICRTR